MGKNSTAQQKGGGVGRQVEGLNFHIGVSQHGKQAANLNLAALFGVTPQGSGKQNTQQRGDHRTKLKQCKSGR